MRKFYLKKEVSMSIIFNFYTLLSSWIWVYSKIVFNVNQLQLFLLVPSWRSESFHLKFNFPRRRQSFPSFPHYCLPGAIISTFLGLDLEWWGLIGRTVNSNFQRSTSQLHRRHPKRHQFLMVFDFIPVLRLLSKLIPLKPKVMWPKSGFSSRPRLSAAASFVQRSVRRQKVGNMPKLDWHKTRWGHKLDWE